MTWQLLRFVWLHARIAHLRAVRATPASVRHAWGAARLLVTPCLLAGLFLAPT